MTPERHRRAKELFHGACDLGAEEREALLSRECGEDADLREHVAALLARYRPPASEAGGAAAARATEPASRLAVGQLVDGKYEVEARIGAGGMGEVYRARQLSLDRTVVLKVLLSDPRPDALRRFEREARALGRLRHANVVTVHDLGVADEVGHYLVMEYVEGRTLRDEVRRHGPMPVVRAVGLMRQVCDGVAAAHSAGVIHRDLKPENVLLEGDGDRVTAKVADFGIARLAALTEASEASLTGTGTVMGTPSYMSPEQSRGDEADERSDVYALGCVLYELLAGRPPFAAGSALGVLEKHRSETPAALDAERPDVPASLARVAARALEKRREARWQTAAELGEALVRAARGDEIVEAHASEPPASPDAVADDPPPNNLTWPLTRCVGREREAAEIASLLVDASPRLVTITGTGGIGKTRLAIEVAHALATSFPDGVFQVDLAPLSDPALLAQRIAHVFGVKESPEAPLTEQLAAFLADKRLLVVLDNFEHLLAAAPLVARLLETAPRVKALVTSQAPLRLRGEREYPLDALAVADPEAPPEEIERSPAVALFLERAREAKPAFSPSPAAARAIAEVCRRVDGLPLAIELAAARVKLLAPEAMLPRLAHRLDLLTSGARDLPERQRTMRGAVSWSYELLDDREKALLRALSVFSGGCTLAAAETVCCDGEDADVLDTLGSLVDKSLVRQRSRGDAEARFGMSEVVREYAVERLEAEGEAEATRSRHARFFFERARETDPRTSSDDASRIASLGRDHENLNAALAFLLRSAPQDGVRMAVACGRYWFFRSLLSEGIGWMRRALATDAAGPADRAALLSAVGAFEGLLGDHEISGGLIDEALEIARTVDDSRVLLDVLNCAAVDRLMQPGRQLESKPYLEEALEIAREIGDANRAASLLSNLGALANAEGDRARVRACTEEALGLCVSTVLRATCLLNLGGLLLEDGDLAGATARIREALVAFRDIGDRAQAADALDSLGLIALKRGAPERAVRLAGAVDALVETTGGVRTHIDGKDPANALAQMREAVEPLTFEREWARGRAMDLDAAVEGALRDD